jgi:hypothetical protein
LASKFVCPPDLGKTDASCAEDRALHKAIKAAIEKETRKAGPASPAAGAITENIPAPRIAANPVATASNRFSCGRNLDLSSGCTDESAIPVSIYSKHLRLF